ncbi:hypothetical protein CaCOL14_008323, partial [Colletotrichum acutatum]
PDLKRQQYHCRNFPREGISRLYRVPTKEDKVYARDSESSCESTHVTHLKANILSAFLNLDSTRPQKAKAPQENLREESKAALNQVLRALVTPDQFGLVEKMRSRTSS